MKKLLLLISSCVVTATANAQHNQTFVSSTPQQSNYAYTPLKNCIRAELTAKSVAYKTTSAAPRWYSYADWFDTSEIDAGSSIGLAAPYLWKDTMSVMAYSGTSGTIWQHNRSVSLGMAMDPSFSGFNDSSYYKGKMSITPANAYTVDSIRFFGRYGFNPAKSAVVDTIRVALVYGDGTYGNATSGPDVYLAKTGNPVVLSAYGVSAPDSMSTYRMHFDTVNVRTKGSTLVVKDVILNNSGTTPAWGDTLSNGVFYHALGFPDINVPAGNLIGATLTFISGDASFVAHDTVFGSTIGYKYNMFRPYVAYRGTSTTPVYATYNVANRNSGMFKTLPDTANKWGGQYIPLWFWSATGGGASTNQYPYIDFHIKCATCGQVNVKTIEKETIKNLSAYPNPASGEIIIPFELANTNEVTVTLTNMMGRIVASRTIQNTSKGSVVFNTVTLPPGIYTASLSAGGSRQSVRIAIQH